MNNFQFAAPKRILFGCGKLNELGAIVAQDVINRVLLITDPGMRATGIVQRACDALAAANVSVAVYDDVQADPPEANILAAAKLASSHNVDGVIGLGGGSSLDVAKLAALIGIGKEKLSNVYGIGKVKGPRLPLILIPTTAGTGSEVTPISIVTTGETQKMGVVSPVLLPDVALVDPELTVGLPGHITAATGIDAIVHAIEAYASASPNNNPISKTLAEKALRLMGASLLTAVHEGSNLSARTDMSLGSMLAGQAFANSPVAAVHALAYPLGGHFHIPHGLSNALMLPHVLRFNIGTAHDVYAPIAPLVFPELSDLDGQARSLAFCERLTELSVACGLPQTLRDMDVPRDMLSTLADDAMKQTRLLVNNPRPVTRADALAIYAAAF